MYARHSTDSSRIVSRYGPFSARLGAGAGAPGPGIQSGFPGGQASARLDGPGVSNGRAACLYASCARAEGGKPEPEQ